MSQQPKRNDALARPTRATRKTLDGAGSAIDLVTEVRP